MTPRYLGMAQGQEVKRTRELWLVSPKSEHRVAELDKERVEMGRLYDGIALVK